MLIRDGSPDPIIYSGTLISGVNITLGGGIYYVDFSATGAGDGTSWQDAFTDLQEAPQPPAKRRGNLGGSSGIYTPGRRP